MGNSWCSRCSVDWATDSCFENAYEAFGWRWGSSMESVVEASTVAACTFEVASGEKADLVSNNWDFETDSGSAADRYCSDLAPMIPSSSRTTRAWIPIPAKFSYSFEIYFLWYQKKKDMAQILNFVDDFSAAGLKFQIPHSKYIGVTDGNWSFEMEWLGPPVDASCAGASLEMEKSFFYSRNDWSYPGSRGMFAALAACDILDLSSRLSCCHFDHCCWGRRWSFLWRHTRIGSDSGLEFTCPGSLHLQLT